jgi:four helix bundle protein
VKNIGKPCAGKPHARFDEGGLVNTTSSLLYPNVRSGTSIGAHYREAYRSRSKAEFIAKAGDCLKELEETANWLELLVECGIVEENRLADLQKECDELTAIFVTIIKTSKKEAETKKN